MKPQYHGLHYIESSIRPENPAYSAVANKVKNGTMIAMGNGTGPGRGILLQRQGDGHYRMYCVVAVPENFAVASSGGIDLSDLDATRALFLSPGFFADWAEDFREFIRHATDFYSWPLYNHPYTAESKKWDSVPGVTVAGDAAHTSTPFAGEGVNCAMTDALALADKIAAALVAGEGGEGDSLDQAVRSYEEDMFARGVRLITKSSRNGQLLFYQEGPEPLVQLLKSGSL